MTGARLGGLLARGLIGGAAGVIVVVATLLTWPWTGVGPSADERRIEDLQRVSHAVDAFRANQHVLPASLTRLPIWPAAPVHIYDPITNRPYDYRPLGPLAYELCARFDGAGPEERRDSWWHDGGRYCFSLETRDAPKPPSAASAEAASPAAHTERSNVGDTKPPEETVPVPGTQPPASAQSAPPAAAEPAPTDAPPPAPPQRR